MQSVLEAELRYGRFSPSMHPDSLQVSTLTQLLNAPLLNPEDKLMDPATLTAFLAPFLPTLLKLGTKALEGAATKAGETTGTKLSEQALNKATAVWEKLHPKVEAKEAAKEAAADVANAPDDADAQAALRLQLKKILEAEPELAQALAQIMQADAPDGTSGTQIVQHVTGNQNQVIGQVTGGNVFGNVTGNVTL